MLNKTLGILVTILLLFSACKDEDSPLSSTKQLNSFSILKGDNQGKIGNDVNALIVGNVLTLSMNKYDDLKSLVATFEYDGKSITVDGIEQESGVTLNDYSQPLAFIIEAEDGSKETYTVKVVLEEKAGFTSFRFLKKNEIGLRVPLRAYGAFVVRFLFFMGVTSVSVFFFSSFLMSCACFYTCFFSLS